jgi:hypothetical protein
MKKREYSRYKSKMKKEDRKLRRRDREERRKENKYSKNLLIQINLSPREI